MRVSLPLLLLSGCSLLVHFNLEGQPCDDAGRCLQGYSCIKGQCITPNTCSQLRCAAGERCTENSGRAACETPGMGELAQTCLSDRDCSATAGQYCYVGSVQTPSGALERGFCTDTCPAAMMSCGNGGICKEFPLGLNAGNIRICVPDALAKPCSVDSECEEGRVCALYDHPKIGPAGICDLPLTGGAAPGASCDVTVVANSMLCAAGLCLPRTPQAFATCHQLCLNSGSCPGGTCALVEVQVSSTTPVRFIPMCVPKVFACLTCDKDGACGADAPHCAQTDAGLRCLPGCASASPNPAPYCPAGAACTATPSGELCLPQTGPCQ